MLLESLEDRLWMSLRLLKLKEVRIDLETRSRSRNYDQARIAQALDVNHVCCMFPELRRPLMGDEWHPPYKDERHSPGPL